MTSAPRFIVPRSQNNESAEKWARNRESHEPNEAEVGVAITSRGEQWVRMDSLRVFHYD